MEKKIAGMTNSFLEEKIKIAIEGYSSILKGAFMADSFLKSISFIEGDTDFTVEESAFMNCEKLVFVRFGSKKKKDIQAELLR